MSRPLALDDLPRLPVVQSPVFFPNGRGVTFNVKRWDLKADRYRSALWIAPLADGGAARALTSGEHSDGKAAVHPSGRFLAFASDRRQGDVPPGAPKRRNLWLLDLKGGEAVALTDLPGDCAAATWSPDGRALAFVFTAHDPTPPPTRQRVSEVLRRAGEDLPESVRRAIESEKDGATIDAVPPGAPISRRITRLHWREDGRGFLPQARAHLYVLRFDGAPDHPAAAGDARLRRLTAGPHDYAWPAFSPDGARLAVVANRSPDPDRQSGLFDLWLIPADSGASVRADDWNAPADGIVEPARVPTPAGPVATPSWSPDGTRLAYLGHTEPLDLWGTTNHHVWAVPVAGGEARDLTPDFDRSALSLVIADMGEMSPYAAPVWRDGGREIAFLATDGGRVRVYAVSSDGGRPRELECGPGSVEALVGDPGGERLAFLSSAPSQPPEVWVSEGGAPARRLTRVTERWRAEFDLPEPQLLPVTVPGEGHTVEAWLLKPPNFDASRRYPLILQIHGGPYAAYGEIFNFELQWMAALGYCVVYANPRGSQGYGYDFGAAIRHDLAAPAHRDLMAVIDVVSARPYVDETRMGITGGSWGGYMTNWVITQDHRFRAAVTQRSICDFESDFGTSDYGYETEWMFGGPPWTHREVYRRCSPLTYVENIRTPLLIVHSDEDWRCPPAQAEQLFVALKYLGREVDFVRFPNEPHGLSRSGTPSRRLARLRVITEWFGERLLAAAAEPEPAETTSTP